MSDIDDLCQIIHRGIGLNFEDMAAEIIAAGFHRDRTITTAEELDALPFGSVIRDDSGEVWEQQNDPDSPEEDGWQATGVEECFHRAFRPILPVAVLYEGGPR